MKVEAAVYNLGFLRQQLLLVSDSQSYRTMADGHVVFDVIVNQIRGVFCLESHLKPSGVRAQTRFFFFFCISIMTGVCQRKSTKDTVPYLKQEGILCIGLKGAVVYDDASFNPM